MTRSQTAAALVIIGWLAAGSGLAQAPTLDGIVEGGRMLVPLRGVFEHLGASVQWYAPTRTVTIRDGTRVIVLQVDYPAGWVDGRQEDLEVPARLVAGRVYVPLRFAAEALGAQVNYARGVAELRRSGEAAVRVHAVGGSY
jgi:hypothetical protein